MRKYTVGTVSTVVAIVFLGFNTSQAHAAETNQPASVVKPKQQSNNEQTEISRISSTKFSKFTKWSIIICYS
ncbi:YSIRK-type signal peptide-containing protein [Staphylococcus aureus]